LIGGATPCCPGVVPFRGLRVVQSAAGPCSDLSWRWSGSGCRAGVPCAPHPRHRLLASPVPRPRWPGAMLQAPGAARRSSSPSEIPHLPMRTLCTRPERGRRRRRSLSCSRRSPGFLSWGSKDRPSVGISAPRPVLAGSALRRFQPSARELPPPRRLPPLPFLPASTVCSAARLAGCTPSGGSEASLPRSPVGVAPATDPGVHAVSMSAAMPRRVDPLGAFRRQSRKDRRGRAAMADTSPVMPYPSERLSSSAAVPPSPAGSALSPSQIAAAGRRAVANRRGDSAGGCRPQGLDPLPSPERGVAVASGSGPMLPWACSWKRAGGVTSVQAVRPEPTVFAVEIGPGSSPCAPGLSTGFRP
jgi:hypothetical protein